jgi:hypothetical protein
MPIVSNCRNLQLLSLAVSPLVHSQTHRRITGLCDPLLVDAFAIDTVVSRLRHHRTLCKASGFGSGARTT